MALDNTNLLSSSTLSPSSDKVLIYRNGGSEASTSLLNLTNSALSVAGVYVDAVNQRVGIGTNSPLATAHIKGIGTTSSTTSLLVQNSAGTTAFNIKDNGVTNATYIEGGMCWFNNINSNGIVKFGSSLSVGFNTDPIAQLQIKGSGSTSATTSLLVQNSSGNNTFRVLDNGFSFMSTGVSFQELKFYPQFSSISGGYGGSITFSNTSNDTTISDNRITLTAPPYSDSLAVGVSGIYAVVTSNAFSINSTTQGFLPPRMSTAQKNAIATPAAGLMVYDTNLNRPCFYSGSAWVTL